MGSNATAEWDNERQDKLGLDLPNLPYFTDGQVRITEHLAIH